MIRPGNKKTIARGRLPPETDYTSYTFSKYEIALHLLCGGMFMAVVSWLFYDSVAAWVLLMPTGERRSVGRESGNLKLNFAM